MNEIGQDETFYVVWDFLVCFSVRLVRKVLLKGGDIFDPGKWVKHLASIVGLYTKGTLGGWCWVFEGI